MKTNRKLDNEKREKILLELIDYFKQKDEDVLRTNSNELVFPYVDEEQNEKWVMVVVKIPTGGRDEDGFDGYGVAESYQLKLAEKERKKKEDAEKKAKKIERDKKIREEKKKRAE